MFQVMTNAFARRQVIGIERIRTTDDGWMVVYFGFHDLDTRKPDVVLLTMRPSDSDWRVDPGKPPEGP